MLLRMGGERQSGSTRKAQIAKEALFLLATGGPHRLTAKRLGAAVGIDHSSIFRHFPDKAAIISAAIELFERRLDESFPPPNSLPLERLRLFFLHRLVLSNASPEIIRCALNPQLLEVAGEDFHAQEVRRIVAKSISFITDCLENAKDDGQISSAVPTTDLVWIVAGILRGASSARDSSSEDPSKTWGRLENLLRKL